MVCGKHPAHLLGAQPNQNQKFRIPTLGSRVVYSKIVPFVLKNTTKKIETDLSSDGLNSDHVDFSARTEHCFLLFKYEAI